MNEKTLAWIFMNCADIPNFVDPVSTFKCLKIKERLAQIHTLKPNKLKAEALTGITIANREGAVKAVEYLHQRGVVRVVLSMGAEGVLYSEKEQTPDWSKALKIKVVNATGAGDAMMAGLVSGWLDNLSLAENVKYVQACSALALSSEYINNPNLSDDNVRKLLEVNYE